MIEPDVTSEQDEIMVASADHRAALEEEEEFDRNFAFAQDKRMAEALVFASAMPVSEKLLAERLPNGVDIGAIMEELGLDYQHRGVNLVRVEDCWAFRTASDLAFLLNRDAVQQRKLSRAALEVL